MNAPNRPDFDPGPLADVERRFEDGRWTLVFVRHLRHPPARVWSALTDPGQLRRWAPFQPDRDLGTTGAATLHMDDGPAVESFAAVVRTAVAPALLEYTWGNDLLRWELAPDGDGTRLTLRHTVESLDGVPRTAAGWHLCLLVAERLLDGAPLPRIVGAEAKKFGWQALSDGYSAKLGIPAAGANPRSLEDGEERR